MCGFEPHHLHHRHHRSVEQARKAIKAAWVSVRVGRGLIGRFTEASSTPTYVEADHVVGGRCLAQILQLKALLQEKRTIESKQQEGMVGNRNAPLVDPSSLSPVNERWKGCWRMLPGTRVASHPPPRLCSWCVVDCLLLMEQQQKKTHGVGEQGGMNRAHNSKPKQQNNACTKTNAHNNLAPAVLEF